jgi:hypothetical protein
MLNCKGDGYMNVETLMGMDEEADRIIADSSVGIEIYTKMMGTRLNEVYGTAIGPDQLAEYGKIAGEFLIDQGTGVAFGYVVSKIGSALKKAYHDRANGKEAPKPEEFRNYILHVEGGVFTLTGGKATLTVTHRDGSVDSR